MSINSFVCPICGNTYNGYPAISRKDNKTEICPDCGVVQALVDYYNHNMLKKNKSTKGR